VITLQDKQLICDEFLVEYYKSKILPNIVADVEKREKLKITLNDFILSKHDHGKVLEIVSAFYRQIDFASFFVKYLNLPREKAEALLQVLRRLQSILFRVPRYRDHLIHQFRVYLLGCYILQENLDFFVEQFANKYSCIINREINKDEEHRKTIAELLLRAFSIRLDLWFDAWALAALCHDLGYAIEGMDIIIKHLAEIYKDLINEFEMKQSVEILSPTTETSIQRNCLLLCIDLVFSSSAATELKQYVDNLSKIKDHGIWCAFLNTPKQLAEKLQNAIIKFREMSANLMLWDLVSEFYSVQGSFIAPVTIAPLLCMEALIAIGFHNRQYLFRLSPLTALLVISDTLQEWGRMSLADYEESYRRCLVYLYFDVQNRTKILEAEIYVTDQPIAEDMYKSITVNFDAHKDKQAVIDIGKIKSEFLQDLKLNICIIASRGEFCRFSV